ncbi:MAG: hypothetical protein WBG19_04245, partial [Thermoplasmata archaeon]
PVAAQAQNAPGLRDDLWNDLQEFVETPSVSGYENQLTEKIRAKLASFHPVVDNLGDVIVTIGSGAPHRLIVTPIDEPGFVVSGITPDGYLRLQRLPQAGNLPPIFNALYSAQPVRIRTSSGKWIDGVVAGISVHLHRASETTPSSSDIENMYVDIGATSAAEASKAGVDILSPVAINRQLMNLANGEFAGASVGDKFGVAALVELLRGADSAQIKGTLTVAFVVQQRVGGRGLERILRAVRADEMIYVGRLLPGGNVPGMEGVHRAPRREPGGGVLIGLDRSNGELSGIAADLKQLADANKIPLAPDYSAGIDQAGYLAPPAFPAKWAHIGIATAWPDTPAEVVNREDFFAMASLLNLYVNGAMLQLEGPFFMKGPVVFGFSMASADTPQQTLQRLVETYGASGHEELIRQNVTRHLPNWAKPETDDAGNLILHIGTAPAGTKTPTILVVAHMDEIGFSVKSISKDGRLEVETLGGMDLSFYEGHPMLVHTASGDRDAIMELPHGW